MDQVEQKKLDKLRVPSRGELLDGRYRVEGTLASGGMGVVLRAQQLPMEREVAVKVLHPHIATTSPTTVERFEREVRLATLLTHPNTIRLYDARVSTEGLIYVVMELLEGANLKAVIARDGPIAAGRAVDLTLQILDGLGEAHALGFIHRDLKPSNVFVTRRRNGGEQIKLLDFGIAKSLCGDADLTASGLICGTPAYVAPEYLLLEKPGKPADVYAAGLILLEMLSGQKTFAGASPAETMMLQIRDLPVIPPAILATPLAGIIRRATAKQPARRFQDAEEMYNALAEVRDRVAADLRVDADWAGGQEKAFGGRAEAVTIDSLEPLDEEADMVWCGGEPLEREAEPEPLDDEPSRPCERGAGKERGLLALGGAALVAAVLVGAWWVDREPAAADASGPVEAVETRRRVEIVGRDQAGLSAEQSSSPRAASASHYRFEMYSHPEAVVFLGGRRLGSTPRVFWVRADQLPQRVTLIREGYRPVISELTRHSAPLQAKVLERDDSRPASRETRRRAPSRAPAEPEVVVEAPSGSPSSQRAFDAVLDKFLYDEGDETTRNFDTQ